MIDHLPLWQQILLTIPLLLISGAIFKKFGFKLRNESVSEEDEEKKRRPEVKKHKGYYCNKSAVELTYAESLHVYRLLDGIDTSRMAVALGVPNKLRGKIGNILDYDIEIPYDNKNKINQRCRRLKCWYNAGCYCRLDELKYFECSNKQK